MQRERQAKGGERVGERQGVGWARSTRGHGRGVRTGDVGVRPLGVVGGWGEGGCGGGSRGDGGRAGRVVAASQFSQPALAHVSRRNKQQRQGGRAQSGKAQKATSR